METVISNFPYSDEPTYNDGLDQKLFVERISRLLEETDAPRVVVIQGGWGTGKTSFMQQTMYQACGQLPPCYDEPENKNDEKSNISKGVWFEAWQYQHENNITAALLKEIRNQLVEPVLSLKKISKYAAITLQTILNSVDVSFIVKPF